MNAFLPSLGCGFLSTICKCIWFSCCLVAITKRKSIAGNKYSQHVCLQIRDLDAGLPWKCKKIHAFLWHFWAQRKFNRNGDASESDDVNITESSNSSTYIYICTE